MRAPIVERGAGLITASLAGLSWVETVDLIIRWGAGGVAIVVGLVTLYQRCRKK